MFANFAEACISTVTAGSPDTFTLGDVTGSPNFDDILGASGTRVVRYTAIEYTSSTRATISKIQSGIGSLDLSTMILTQTLIQETWNGTAYDNTAPAELTFTAGTDTTRVFCTPLVQDFMRTPPGTCNISGALGATTDYGIFPMNGGQSTGTVSTMTADVESWKAILWGGQNQIDQISIRSGTTGGNMKSAWYEMQTDGLPGLLLKDFGIMSIATNANNVLAVSGFHPPPGWYWQATVFDAAVNVRGSLGSSSWGCPAGVDSTGAVIVGYTRTGSYSTGLPSTGATSSPTAVTSAVLNNALPAISYRMAA